jgi:hypothetical protein
MAMSLWRVVALASCFLPIGITLAQDANPLGPETFLVNPASPGEQHYDNLRVYHKKGDCKFQDSARFRICNATSEAAGQTALKLLESAYECFVGPMGWRTSGLSVIDSLASSYYKMNAYGVKLGGIGSAAGVMGGQEDVGHAFIKVIDGSITEPGVIVHEFGHAMTFYENNYVNASETGAWWEPIAEFYADTFVTSPWCKPARLKYGFTELPARTRLSLWHLIGSSHKVLVDGTPAPAYNNYYQSWPFLSYLSYNPDEVAGLGRYASRDMFRKFTKRAHETPLHVIQRMVEPTATLGGVVSMYWARMSVGEIGMPRSRSEFVQQGIRAKLLDQKNSPLVEAEEGGKFRVKEDRMPKYFGANIVPLKGAGQFNISVNADAPFIALVSIRSSSGEVKLVELSDGQGVGSIAADDEANLVVTNTPLELLKYDPFRLPVDNGNARSRAGKAETDAAKGLTYEVEVSGVQL